jgi:hypothetical protein
LRNINDKLNKKEIMDILKEITKEEHKKHSLVQNWHKEELSYFIQKLIDKALKKQLTLTDVVASLLCVDSEGFSFIMEGETYNLLEESDTLYKIADDDGDEFWYDKKHFVKNKK